VNGVLVAVTITLSLTLAGWSLLATARNRPPDLLQLVGLAVLEMGLLALVVLALVAWGGGHRPGEPETFLGYVVTLVCLPPLAGVLARMEPTRWGSVIVGVVCLVIPVVIMRLQQTWEIVGG
jgi:hypothetical protein